MKKSEFPNNFFFGGSTSASQIEGAHFEDGKGLGITDLFTQGSKTQPRLFTKTHEKDKIYPSLSAIDFYTYYKEDIAMLAELGINSFRLSFDWSRLFPTGEEKEPNPKGVEFYQNVIDELLLHKIEPIVTLSHSEIPYTLTEKYGGFKSEKVVEYFLNYCKTMFEIFKGKITFWLVFNEINHLLFNSEQSNLLGYFIAGYNLNGDKNFAQTSATISFNMLRASASVAIAARKIDPRNKVGCVTAHTPMYPASCDPNDALATLKHTEEALWLTDVLYKGEYPDYKLKEYERLNISLDITPQDKQLLKEGVMDYIGLNYYSSGVIKAMPTDKDAVGFFGGIINPYLKPTKWGWCIDPVGLRYTLLLLNERYKKPILITENGLGAEDTVLSDGTINDNYRIEFLKEHIEQVQLSLSEDSVNCIGYLWWGPIDLVSGSTGEMRKRYGFIYVDKHDDGSGTLKRSRKASYYWVKDFLSK